MLGSGLLRFARNDRLIYLAAVARHEHPHRRLRFVPDPLARRRLLDRAACPGNREGAALFLLVGDRTFAEQNIAPSPPDASQD
jgi:hypothetical protein